MTLLVIPPTDMQSRGGLSVTITGINPADHDCLKGQIDTKGMGTINASWDLNGTMRSGTDDCNLDLTSKTGAILSEMARRLSAPL